MDELETAFRDAMARVAAPVTVITTDDGNRPSGTTVSAFASLSVTPPMVMFALDNRGGMIDRLREAGRVGVNILAGDQADVAIKFAGKHLAERFAGIDWHRDHGLPRIDGIVAWVRCEDLTFLPGGDHTIVTGTVAAAEISGDSSLGYHLREFRDNQPSFLAH